ncbi:helix-turn-helix transcriptional regulator [Vagococcus carniphilus]|uniref:helix-turn-helix domain-containing protein n=1 Tax=Vagococcus carniphilus TaxID=218144 RepID=UPI00288F6038|nr:helix-turn-helix transcriptional regulator [Vagococcus carniphilus]MDT2830589.1 helix-turn-helix transcriptional regulator [Vagococcus carniphilus]MDT2839888.1 helix-turn-helix transcriptional regulator [Vagococcus carniphilus]MDT2854666.1 helix-turn-helix transcriptional regulator [Vagococcus carniphilus]
MNIGSEIKKRRIELNLTQEDLAKQLNVSRTAVSNWEQQRNYPDIELLVNISDLLDISLDKLLRGDSKMVKELNMDYKKKKKYKILVPLFILITLLLSGYIYAITSTVKYYRYNPFATISTGYAVLPEDVTYNNGLKYNEVTDSLKIPDAYKNIEVIDNKTTNKVFLTFQGGQSPKGKNFGKIKYKDDYVYELEFISWNSIPKEVQQYLSKE